MNCYNVNACKFFSVRLHEALSKAELCSRRRCSGVRGGGGLPDAADTLAENDQRRFTAGVFGLGSHSARFGGALPLQEGQCSETWQKESKGQEEQKEMSTNNYLNKFLKKPVLPALSLFFLYL